MIISFMIFFRELVHQLATVLDIVLLEIFLLLGSFLQSLILFVVKIVFILCRGCFCSNNPGLPATVNDCSIQCSQLDDTNCHVKVYGTGL